MAFIRPCADLRNNYSEISKICDETKKPIYITRNGTNDLVVLSDEVFESITKTNQDTEEERINKLISQQFDKHYGNFKDFQKDLFEKITIALTEVDQGKAHPIKEFFEEMEAKYPPHE